MYKIFRGFPLVEAYQDLKKAKRLAESQAVARCIKLVIAITISLTLWLLPTEAFGISNLTIIEQRLISIFIFATLMWVFEAVPAWTTSVLIVSTAPTYRFRQQFVAVCTRNSDRRTGTNGKI